MAAIVSVDVFNSYIGSFEEDTNGLKQIFLDSAESLVIDYIGYDFRVKDYSEVIEGIGYNYIQLSALPINSIASITIDGDSLSASDYVIKDECISLKAGVFPSGSSIAVAYNAGYSSYPGIVKLVELQIAALLFSEANGNIGVTSKSMDGGNTRTFYKTTDFSVYLKKLDSLVLRKLNV